MRTRQVLADERRAHHNVCFILLSSYFFECGANFLVKIMRVNIQVSILILGDVKDIFLVNARSFKL